MRIAQVNSTPEALQAAFLLTFKKHLKQRVAQELEVNRADTEPTTELV